MPLRAWQLCLVSAALGFVIVLSVAWPKGFPLWVIAAFVFLGNLCP